MTSVARRQDHDSGDYSDASQQEIEQDISGNDGGQPESDYESQGSDTDQSEGDPESQETERRVDDDEDRSNPQYIPKRGTFYEHDDRTAASGDETSNTTSETASEKKEGVETAAGERRRPPRKSETGNKWSHDKYNENEQMPKTRDELVTIYGYDIRNEDAPPHARRNRRYGRGPNKYTRTWEDEEAYRRQAAAPQLNRRPPTAEDFPELDAANRNSNRRAPRPRSKSQPSSNDSVESGSALRRNASVKNNNNRPAARPQMASRMVKGAPKREPREPRESRDPRESREQREKMPPLENLTITATGFNNRFVKSAPKRESREIREPREKMPPLEKLSITANMLNNRFVKSAPKRESRELFREPRERKAPLENYIVTANVPNNSQGLPQRKLNAGQQRPVPTELGRKKPSPPLSLSHSLNNSAPSKSPPRHQPAPPQQQKQQQIQQNQQSQQQTASGPESRGGSKRYSSLRQRPLDTYSPPQQQQNQQQQQAQQQNQQHRYHAEYPGGAPPSPAGPAPGSAASAAQHQGSPAPQLHPQQLMQQMHRGSTVNQPAHGPSPPHQPIPQQLPQQQLPQQQLPQQQLPQQQLPQQQLPQQQLSQQQLSQQQLAQQQLPQQQLPQQQLSQQQLPQQHNPQVRLGILDQQQLVSHPHHAIHTMPPPQPHAMGPLQPAQGYAPPAMMPAQYMQQSGTAAVFPGAPIYAQPPAPYPHPTLYQHHNFAGGVTYYSCAEQEQLPRAQRRPTAAIPIVRPAPPERPSNSSEKDNIDRIVENMFVRKPWPAQGQDASKEKQPSENRNSQEPASKEASQPNSLTSSSISTDSKPSEGVEKEDSKEDSKPDLVSKQEEEAEIVMQDSIADA